MNHKEEMEEQTGFKFQTDIWEKFTEAEASKNNLEDIEELYREYFREWHNDVKKVAELSMCMNWKIWEHYYAHNEELSEVYNELWLRVDWYAKDVFVWDDWKYYFSITD